MVQSLCSQRIRQGLHHMRLPHQLVMFVGQAWLPDGAEVTPDHEHDAHAWWPPDVADWPEEAHADLRQIPVLLGEA